MFNSDNMQNILKQAQAMQENITNAQSTLKAKKFVGKAGGDWVIVTLNGAHEPVDLKIHSEAMKEPADVLADLILAALRQAHTEIEGFTKGELGKLLQGVDLPPELK